MKRKIAFVLFVVTVFCTLGAIQAFGATNYPRHQVILEANEAYDYSDTCVGTYKYVWGSNNYMSKHKVWIIAQRYDGSEWVDDSDAKYLLSVGEIVNEDGAFRSTIRSSEVTWRCMLDPYLYNWDCVAIGYIRNA